MGEGKRRAEERGYRKPQVCAVWWVGGLKRGQWKSEGTLKSVLSVDLLVEIAERLSGWRCKTELMKEKERRTTPNPKTNTIKSLTYQDKVLKQ